MPESNETCTPAEHAAFQAVCLALSDVQLQGLLYVCAHAVAHRQGRFEHMAFTIEVNAPEEPMEKKGMIVLPGGQS